MQGSGFRIEGEHLGAGEPFDPGIQRGSVGNSLVVRRRRWLGLDLVDCLRNPALELEIPEPLQQCRLIRSFLHEGVIRETKIEVDADGCEIPRQRQLIECGAQILPDLATDLVGLRHDRVEIAVLVEPFCGRLRPTLLDAGNVVDRIADQRKVVDDPFRRHAELFHHPRGIHRCLAHGIHQRDSIGDELREVLV